MRVSSETVFTGVSEGMSFVLCAEDDALFTYLTKIFRKY